MSLQKSLMVVLTGIIHCSSVDIESTIKGFLERQQEFQETFLMEQQRLTGENRVLSISSVEQKLLLKVDRLRARLKRIQKQHSQDIDSVMDALEQMNNGLNIKFYQSHQILFNQIRHTNDRLDKLVESRGRTRDELWIVQELLDKKMIEGMEGIKHEIQRLSQRQQEDLMSQILFKRQHSGQLTDPKVTLNSLSTTCAELTKRVLAEFLDLRGALAKLTSSIEEMQRNELTGNLEKVQKCQQDFHPDFQCSPPSEAEQVLSA